MATQWTQIGWHVEVVTEHITEWSKAAHGLVFQDEVDRFAVHRIPLRKRYNLQESLQELFLFSKSRKFVKEVEKRVDVSSFDILVGFTYRTFPLFSVKKLARKYRKPCVMDCRDIIEQYPPYKFLPTATDNPLFLKRGVLSILRKIFIFQRNQFLQQAGAITTVSPWHCETLKGYFPDKSIESFYNGFEETIFTPRHPRVDLFRIVFTGRLLSVEHANPSLFFDILKSEELSDIINTKALEVRWYVDAHSEGILRKQLEQQPEYIKEMQHFYSMVPFRKVADILSESSIVLLLAHPEGAKGIVSTKIFEAMAMEKPILMVRSDDAIRSTILRDANAGCAVEKQKDAIDFIKKYYAYWKENGYTCIENQNKTYVKGFSRSDIATKYASLLEQVILANRKKEKKNEATK
ncbi:Glycosyltransferase involved in cell wall bisynthesis [Porphyromonas circumdentaria]|uniref:Glycosyltransferase involved in cell wall bisynthesis n=2 Tax=Porphyromonas circumdentaria TaxID=29524 RepID=A0A1T4MC86_9PORP|nr:Glycosyltransferase involved in cell wall bisynthesis [Porphyromonas circumdentaria]